MKSALIVLGGLAWGWAGCRAAKPEGSEPAVLALAAAELERPGGEATEPPPPDAAQDAGAQAGAAGEPSTEAFLAQLEACETEACRREHVIARVEASSPRPPPATGERAGSGLGEPAAPVERGLASRLEACETSRCVFELLPTDRRPPIGFEGCKPLDGRVSIARADDGVELGLFCRLRIARAKAARRRQAPCTDLGGPNPDFTVNHQALRMLAFNELVSDRHVRRRGWARSQRVLGNNSALHDSYVFDKGVSDRAGQLRAVARAYFCLSGEPGRYYPYFFALLQAVPEVSGGVGAFSPQRTLVAEYIEALPAGPHVAHQLGDVDAGDARLYELADLDGDGVQDLIVLDERRDGAARQQVLRVCLFEPRARDCRLLSAPVRLPAGDAGRGPELRFAEPTLKTQRRTVTVGFGSGEEPAPLRARFRVKKRELVQLDE